MTMAHECQGPKCACHHRDSVPQRIVQQCEAIKELLLSKNKAYGNSALEPVQTFTQGDALEQIAVRCDDKLKRIKNMGGLVGALRRADGEDTVADLIGYLLLARVAWLHQLAEHEPRA